MPVVVVGLSHRTAPVEVRERFALNEAAIPAVLAELKAGGLAEEGVIVSTCNRFELYAAAETGAPALVERVRVFLRRRCPSAGPLEKELYAYPEPQSLEHLFRVVSGLDSMVLGETEILGQVKKAYDLAFQHRHTGRRLNKAFQRAFNVAKHVRTETNIQRGNVSVATVAVELAERIFESLAERSVLVIGAGDTSEKTARALASRGVGRVLVTNRSLDRAQVLAAQLGGAAIPFDHWAGEFDRVDIVISSTSAPGYVLDPARLEPLMSQRPDAPLLLIDIAVPRDIDPEVNRMEDVFLYNIDDLQSIADDALRQRQEEVARCEAIIREKVKALLSAPTGPPPADPPSRTAVTQSPVPAPPGGPGALPPGPACAPGPVPPLPNAKAVTD